MIKTKITYQKNGCRYSHVFPAQVSWATIETYLIMTARISRSAIRGSDVQRSETF